MLVQQVVVFVVLELTLVLWYLSVAAVRNNAKRITFLIWQ